MPPINHLKHALFTFLLTTSWLRSKRCELGDRASACISRTSVSSESQVYIYFLTKCLQTHPLELSTYTRLAFLPFVTKILMFPVTVNDVCSVCLPEPQISVISFPFFPNDHIISISPFYHAVWTRPGIPTSCLEGCFLPCTLSCSLGTGGFTVLAQALLSWKLKLGFSLNALFLSSPFYKAVMVTLSTAVLC